MDLGASSFAGELAQALYLLDGVITPAARAEVMAALETRIFAPMRTAYQTGRGPWWMTADMNWNAVCLVRDDVRGPGRAAHPPGARFLRGRRGTVLPPLP